MYGRRRTRGGRLGWVAGAWVGLVLLGVLWRGWSGEDDTVVVTEHVTGLKTLAGDSLFHPGDSEPAVHILEKHVSRSLLSTSLNCTPPAIEQFPPSFFTPEQRRQGAIIVHIVISLYMFLGLALACDEYFVPSLERICELMGLSSDVAGATFMAAGSSAPELATAVIGVFIAEDDIGLGAVVGSAVFNIMFVISVCALFAGMVVYLNWWPLFRDCAFYTLSIVALVLVIYDGFIKWYESFILLLLYVLYIIIMIFNKSIEKWVHARVACCGIKPNDENELILYKKKQEDQPGSDSDDDENPAKDYKDTHALLPSSVEFGNHAKHLGEDPFPLPVHTHLDDDESPLTMPESCGKRVLWFISLPLILFMFITVPDCRQVRWKRWFLVTFIMSILWISLYSYLMVWMITVIGFTLSIPDTVMGLTFIAAGVSVPDAIASLLVVRDGYGDMAVSNAVGSNVFDILLCLGLPWFIHTVIYKPGSVIEVYSSGLTYSALTLLSTVIFLIVATHINGWKLDKRYGVVLMVVYVIFTVLATLYELNVFGYFHPPECPSTY